MHEIPLIIQGGETTAGNQFMTHRNASCLMAGLLFVLAFGASLPVRAGDAEKEAAELKIVSQYLALANHYCSSSMSVRVDWPSFDGNYIKSYEELEVANYCGQGVKALGEICRDNAQVKQNIQSGIDAVDCSWDSGALEGPFVRYGDSRMNLRFNWETPNIFEDVYVWARGK